MDIKKFVSDNLKIMEDVILKEYKLKNKPSTRAFQFNDFDYVYLLKDKALDKRLKKRLKKATGENFDISLNVKRFDSVYRMDIMTIYIKY